MKKYEKILTITILVLFGLQLSPNFSGKSGLFTLGIWLLALSYLIGGYWLFNPKEHKKYFLPIVAGIAFAASIIALPFVIRVRLENVYYFFPIINGLLCIGLVIFLILNRKTGKITSSTKNIFRRSVILLIISSFFTYTPIHSFKPFRHILMALNRGDEYLVNNLLMFDYAEEYETALDKGDCDRAIEFALKANKSGKIWLGIEDENKQTDIAPGELDAINGSYISLYKAYRCKANTERKNKRFNDALLNYKIAHAYLIACNYDSKYWEKEKSWSLNNIAYCYMKLKENQLADSLYVEAINSYKKITDTTDYGLAILYSNIAFSLARESYFSYSSSLFRVANSILRKDTASADNRKNLAENYKELAKNLIQQDSLKSALFVIQRAMKLSNKNESEYCETILYYGICLFKLNEYQKADSVFKSCLVYYEAHPKGDWQNIAACDLLLSQVNIILAKYDEARKYVNTGIKIAAKHFGTNSSQYANYLTVLAHLNKIMSNYPISEKQYHQVIEIYTKKLNGYNKIFSSVLVGLADLEITISEYSLAKKHADDALSIASNFLPLSYHASTDLLNNSAYVDYCLGLYKPAYDLYRKVIDINDNYGLSSNRTTAIALNGLALIETSKRNFEAADSLFQQSLVLHKKLFTDNNPLTAIVYLNYGNLCMQKGQFELAEENLNKAFTIDRQFFKSDHDIFGDILVARGDLAKRRKQNGIAKDYYQKAFDIYKKKFNDKHWKIIATKRKLK